MKNFLVSGDEDAVSTALGFFIITGILVTVFSIFMATQVPQWTREFEAEHADKVPLEFAEFASEIDMAVLRGDTEALTECGIEMKPGAVPLLGVHASGGTLRFNDSSERFSYVACAPGDAAPPPDGIWHWNSTPSDFLNYDKFQVAVHDYGAELALELGEDKTIEKSHEYLAGTFRFNHFVVTKSSKLHTSDLIIYARNITVESGAEINADGGGSAGGIQDQPGKGGGPGQNNADNDSAGGGGAGHGGAGGDGGKSTHGDGGAGGPAYEDPTDDTMALAGSGGGGGSTGELIPGLSQIIAGEGGNGGGSILLHAPVINIAGKLSVNGANGDDGGGGDDSAGGGGGGGSGGCILLKGDNVTVSGTGNDRLYANGGNGGDGGHSVDRRYWVNDSDGGGGGGGAGGIIKIFYDSNLTFSGIGEVDGGNGGDGGNSTNETLRGVDGAEGFFDSTGSRIPYSPEVRYYATGYLISNVTSTQGHVGYNNPDDTSLVCYRAMIWDETVDEDTDIVMKVRTSVDKNMTTAKPWDECTPVVNGMNISDLPSVSDGHKYIQWRADLITRDLAKTPVLHSVNVSYEYGIPFLVNTSGSVQYSSQYLYLPNFKLVYAHGATLRNQTAGEFMLSAPPVAISKDGGITELKITAINLTGDSSTFSGGLRTTVKSSYHDSALITGGLNFLNLSINISTDYPRVWEKWFNDTCEEAGLSYGTDPSEYNISGTGNHLTIAFYGNETRPVNIWLKSAEAKIEIEKKLL